MPAQDANSVRSPTSNQRRGANRRPPLENLASLLNAYLLRDGRSLNRIAQASLVDVAYLWRLKTGAKKRPSRDLLIRVALVLRLEPEELDELLVSVDYTPVTWRSA